AESCSRLRVSSAAPLSSTTAAAICAHTRLPCRNCVRREAVTRALLLSASAGAIADARQARRTRTACTAALLHRQTQSRANRGAYPPVVETHLRRSGRGDAAARVR